MRFLNLTVICKFTIFRRKMSARLVSKTKVEKYAHIWAFYCFLYFSWIVFRVTKRDLVLISWVTRVVVELLDRQDNLIGDWTFTTSCFRCRVGEKGGFETLRIILCFSCYNFDLVSRSILCLLKISSWNTFVIVGQHSCQYRYLLLEVELGLGKSVQ